MEQNHLLQARLTITWWLERETSMGRKWDRGGETVRRHRSGPPGLTDPAVPSLFSMGREHPPCCCHATESDQQITGLRWPISKFRGSEILGKKQEEKMGLGAGARPSSWLRYTAGHCHRLVKTNTNRSCLKEEGQDSQ